MQSFAVSCSDAASIVEKPRARSLTVAVASSFFLTWDNFHQEILKTSDSWLES